jgi:hypothetical protein
MLYGYNKGLQTIVTAASSLDEFKEWQSELAGHLYREANETDFMEHLTNPDYQKLAGSAIVVDFDHEYNQGEFTRIHEIVMLQPAQAVDRNVEMIHYEKPDVFDAADERTIEEIHGLNKEDRWDHRDDAERAEDSAMREKIKEMKKNDQLSGESFSPRKKGGVAVDRIDVSHDAEGKIQIDGVLAQKYTGTELEDQIEGSSKLAAQVAAEAALEGERKQQRKIQKTKELEEAVARAAVLGK